MHPRTLGLTKMFATLFQKKRDRYGKTLQTWKNSTDMKKLDRHENQYWIPMLDTYAKYLCQVQTRIQKQNTLWIFWIQDTGYILPCRIPMPDTGHFQILTFLYIIY